MCNGPETPLSSIYDDDDSSTELLTYQLDCTHNQKPKKKKEKEKKMLLLSMTLLYITKTLLKTTEMPIQMPTAIGTQTQKLIEIEC